jgi:hypothetical protein
VTSFFCAENKQTSASDPQKKAGCPIQAACFFPGSDVKKESRRSGSALQIPGLVLVVSRRENEEQESGKDQPYDKRTHVGLLLSYYQTTPIIA